MRCAAVKIGREIGFVRGAGDHADLLSDKGRGRGVLQRALLAHREARGRLVIGLGEIDLLAQRGGGGERGDQRVALSRLQRIDQRVPAARLDRAADMQFLADRARDLDIETGEFAVGAHEIERGIIVRSQEADRAQARSVGFVQMQSRIPEAGGGVGARGRNQQGKDDPDAGPQQVAHEPPERFDRATQDFGHRQGSPGDVSRE